MKVKGETGTQTSLVAVDVVEDVGRIDTPGLADGKDVPPGKDALAHLLEHFMDSGLVTTQRSKGQKLIAALVAIRSLDIRPAGCLGQHIDYIQPESIHPAIKPAVEHGEDGVPHLRVRPVQIRLFAGEQMQIVITGLFIPFPCGSLESGLPIVRRERTPSGWVRATRVPMIPIPLRAGFGGPGFDKPRMLVGGMIHHLVHDQPQAAGFHGRQ